MNFRSDKTWLRLGYSLTFGLLALRLAWLASGGLQLCRDEAYQWLWSKHLALSYYSKPLGIAFVQFAGTRLFGDTELGVRCFAPVFTAILCLALLRFIAREVGARTAFLLLAAITCAPLLAVGSILMTIDQPLVFFGTLGMLIGWRALQPDGRLTHWVGVGLAFGAAFLSKYSAVYDLFCLALFFLLWPPARAHLKKPGPWLALVIFGLCTLPVVIWNSRHDWITLNHVAENAGLHSKWHPSLWMLVEFLGAEAGLLNPVFFLASIWAMFAMWKRRPVNPLWIYFFCLSAPIFLGHALYALHSRILPNWIALGVAPMFCLMVAYWDSRWRAGARALRIWMVSGLALGFVAVTLMHAPEFFVRATRHVLPQERDPLRRLRGWVETAGVVEARREQLAREGKPVFIIADHYGLAGLFSFYLPAARSAVGREPMVYCPTSTEPSSQLYLWPEYRYREHRAGQNAIYVSEMDSQPLEKDWFWKWWKGETVRSAPDPSLSPTPRILIEEFDSVTDLGVQPVYVSGEPNIFRRLRLFECRNLKPPRE